LAPVCRLTETEPTTPLPPFGEKVGCGVTVSTRYLRSVMALAPVSSPIAWHWQSTRSRGQDCISVCSERLYQRVLRETSRQHKVHLAFLCWRGSPTMIIHASQDICTYLIPRMRVASPLPHCLPIGYVNLVRQGALCYPDSAPGHYADLKVLPMAGINIPAGINYGRYEHQRMGGRWNAAANQHFHHLCQGQDTYLDHITAINAQFEASIHARSRRWIGRIWCRAVFASTIIREWRGDQSVRAKNRWMGNLG